MTRADEIRQGTETQALRTGGRTARELRALSIERGFNLYAEGSAMIKLGSTIVHCTASVEDRAPGFLRGSGTGWLTAEYDMLPRATHDRTQRDVQKGRINGRSSEIQRLIGRSLRSALDLDAIGERTVWIDCDVLQADGGTRTASITCGFVCLVDAMRTLRKNLSLPKLPMSAQVGAVSVGKVGGAMLLDLDYEEDKSADVDCNIVMNGKGEFVELQGTGENGFFSRSELDEILFVAGEGLQKIFELQREVLSLSPEEAELFDGFSSK
ncbi:MAG: ribonuclease PH [Synergistaceae bacterium]|jgi:ribonuclease PH|nr:ribonuclease PH [Synergistaceae bacterium]